MSKVRDLKVLVCDDQPEVRHALSLLLKGAGHRAEAVENPRQLLQALEMGSYDSVLMDMNYSRDTTSGQEGLAALDVLRRRNDYTPTIVMTAWSSIELAVEAMQRGACDFVQKPWDNATLIETLHRWSFSRSHLRSEMQRARSVQQKLFPIKSIQLQTVDYAGLCEPAEEIGGDYYDFFDLGSGRVGFVLADVSGKGTASALLMANLQALFRSHTSSEWSDTPSLLASINALFFGSSPAEQYATVFFGTYSDASRELSYVNCGHHPPVLIRFGTDAQWLGATGMPLGMFAEWKGEERAVMLERGDRLLLFSDGVLEAGIGTGEDFGAERLVKLIRQLSVSSAKSLVERLASAIHKFAPHQDDDLTLVAFQGL
jgi:phosphoserine phosphatase RsbU/P